MFRNLFGVTTIVAFLFLFSACDEGKSPTLCKNLTEAQCKSTKECVASYTKGDDGKDKFANCESEELPPECPAALSGDKRHDISLEGNCLLAAGNTWHQHKADGLCCEYTDACSAPEAEGWTTYATEIECQVDLISGCHGDDECAWGTICERGESGDFQCVAGCRDDDGCDRGYICEAEVCIATNGVCEKDHDCLYEQMCQNGGCIDIPCEVDTDCARGQMCVAGLPNDCIDADGLCDSDWNCQSDELCRDGHCYDNDILGECRLDGDCNAGHLCLWLCVTPDGCNPGDTRCQECEGVCLEQASCPNSSDSRVHYWSRDSAECDNLFVDCSDTQHFFRVDGCGCGCID